VLAHDELNSLLLGLQSTITVHFDQNQPNAERGLPKAAGLHYAGHFQRLGDRLRDGEADPDLRALEPRPPDHA
jgi:hypothetical protein